MRQKLSEIRIAKVVPLSAAGATTFGWGIAAALAGRVFSLMLVFRALPAPLARLIAHITTRCDISHASTDWQIPRFSPFAIASR